MKHLSQLKDLLRRRGKRFVVAIDSGDPTPRTVLATGDPATAPRGLTTCGLNLASFLDVAALHTTDRPPRDGQTAYVRRPCGRAAAGAIPLRTDDLVLKTAALGSRHPAYAGRVAELRALGLKEGSGEYGQVVLAAAKDDRRTLMRFIPHLRDVYDHFALVLTEVAPDLLDVHFGSPQGYPGGFKEEAVPFLLTDDLQTPFNADNLDFSAPPWTPLRNKPDGRAAFAQLVAAYRAVLLGHAGQYAGLTLGSGEPVVHVIERVLAAAEAGGQTLPERVRAARTALGRLMNTLRSSADKSEVLLWFLKLLYHSEFLSGVPAGKMYDATRDAKLAQVVQSPDAVLHGYAPPLVSGSSEEQDKYAALFTRLSGRVWELLLCPDEDFDATAPDAPAELRAVVRQLRDDPSDGVFLRKLAEMSRDAEKSVVVEGVKSLVEMVARDVVLKRLFNDPSLTDADVDRMLKQDLVLCVLLHASLTGGRASDVAGLIDEHRLDIDEQSGEIRDKERHAAELIGAIVKQVGLSPDIRDTVVERLPRLTRCLPPRGVGGVESVFPVAPPQVLPDEFRTSGDNTPAHPGQALKVIGAAVGREVKALAGGGDAPPDPDASEVDATARELVRTTAPASRDANGRWEQSVAKSVTAKLARDKALVRAVADQRLAFDTTFAQVAQLNADHAEKYPAVKLATERLLLALLIRSDSRIVLGTPEASQLKLFIDLMACDPENPAEVARTLTLTKYFTAKQLERLTEIRSTLEWASRTRYPMARLMSDLHGLSALLDAAQKAGGEVLIFLGPGSQFVPHLRADNLGLATTGGLFRAGKMSSGEAIPCAALVVGATMTSGAYPVKALLNDLRTTALAEHGQVFLLPTALLSVGHADEAGNWAREGKEISDAALGGDGADEVSAFATGPSPVVGADPQVTIPAAYLVAARMLGADCSGYLSPAAADVSEGRFHSLAAADMNAALDRVIWGKLTPESDGVNAGRCVAADSYADTAVTVDAALEASGTAPAPTWVADVLPSFEITPKTADRTAYRDAAKTLDGAVIGERAKRFGLSRDAAGRWHCRIAISPSHALDADDGKGRHVAAYDVGHIAAVRRRAKLSPEPRD